MPGAMKFTPWVLEEHVGQRIKCRLCGHRIILSRVTKTFVELSGYYHGPSWAPNACVIGLRDIWLTWDHDSVIATFEPA